MTTSEGRRFEACAGLFESRLPWKRKYYRNVMSFQNPEMFVCQKKHNRPVLL